MNDIPTSSRNESGNGNGTTTPYEPFSVPLSAIVSQTPPRTTTPAATPMPTATTTTTTSQVHLELEEPYDEQFEHELTDERDYDEEDNPTSRNNASSATAVAANAKSSTTSEIKPQIKMSVAADAPWRERLWEGMCVCVLCVCACACIYKCNNSTFVSRRLLCVWYRMLLGTAQRCSRSHAWLFPWVTQSLPRFGHWALSRLADRKRTWPFCAITWSCVAIGLPRINSWNSTPLDRYENNCETKATNVVVWWCGCC
jgi:hypothetical protein